ncbi:MAG TPA: dihydrofolate reductase family protein, partial [Anaerolineaceae bacterium]
LMVPRETANERDWRLYQELAAQADLILSSGRYLREWSLGRAQEILQVDEPRFADLRAWRLSRGLKPTADIGVISSRLEFPVPPVLSAGGRRLIAITAGKPDAERVKLIRDGGGEVIIAGEADVEGPELMRQLVGLGYHTVYSAAGPRILQLLTTGGVLDRLYLTWAGVLLGGETYATLYEGPRLIPPAGFRPASIYLDRAGPGGTGQLFLAYDRV